MKGSITSVILTLFIWISRVSAVYLDVDDLDSIKNATSLIATGLLDYYDGTKHGGTIGMFTTPYYWWEAGGAWGSLIDYTYFMENDTLVPLIKEALLYQTGDDNNYIPLNQSTTEGNDDQGFWGIAVMGAAERNFSNPDNDDDPGWLELAQAVFNTMTARWDDADCGGGLRWQIFQWNSGYNYKNTVSNGCLFHIASRLARYTSNDTYMDWAEKVYDWMEEVHLLTQDNYWFVWDGVYVDNCSKVTKLQWTYNQALIMSGCAYLYNYTGHPIWLNRTLHYLNGAQVFFNNSIMYEAACQPSNNCNNDQRSFKAFFARFLGITSVLVPDASEVISKLIRASAEGAASACSGGTDGHTCGLNWFQGSWDGKYGLGEQMAALEVIQNLRAPFLPAPYTANEGTSKGNPAAGYGSSLTDSSPLTLDAGDKAGAGIITAILGIAIIGSSVWLIL